MSRLMIAVVMILLAAPRIYSSGKNSLTSDWIGFVGKYPYEVFEAKADLLADIKDSLGDNFERFDEWFAVQGTGTLYGNIDGYFLILEGGKAHDTSSYDASIVINIITSQWWVILRDRESDPDVYEIFSNEKTDLPESIESVVDWQVDIYPFDLSPFKD